MSLTARQISETAGNAVQGQKGSLDVKVSGVSTPERISDQSLVFVSDLETAQSVMKSAATTIFAPMKLSEAGTP